MNILDENIIDNQRRQLKSWRISVRQIGYEIGRKGMKDREIIPVRKEEVATFVRRVLRHRVFKTKAKRMGKVIRASHIGLSVWNLHAEKEERFDWDR